MVRPYKLYGKTELDAIKKHLAKSGNQWKSQWFISGHDAVTITADELLPDAVPQASQYFCVMQQQTIDMVVETKALNELLGKIINSPTANSGTAKLSELSKSVVENCLLDLLITLVAYDPQAQEYPVLIDTPQSLNFEASAGMINVCIAFTATRINLLIPYELLKSMAGATAVRKVRNVQPLERRENSKLTANTSLSLLIGHTELEYGAINNLCVGDVIRLDSKIDDPVSVVTDDNISVCHAYVGRQGNKKVAKVILNK